MSKRLQIIRNKQDQISRESQRMQEEIAQQTVNPTRVRFLLYKLEEAAVEHYMLELAAEDLEGDAKPSIFKRLFRK